MFSSPLVTECTCFYRSFSVPLSAWGERGVYRKERERDIHFHGSWRVCPWFMSYFSFSVEKKIVIYLLIHWFAYLLWRICPCNCKYFEHPSQRREREGGNMIRFSHLSIHLFIYIAPMDSLSLFSALRELKRERIIQLGSNFTPNLFQFSFSLSWKERC